MWLLKDLAVLTRKCCRMFWIVARKCVFMAPMVWIKLTHFSGKKKLKSVALTQRRNSSLAAVEFPQTPAFLMCKLEGSESEAEFNTAARPGSCDQAGRRRSTFTPTQHQLDFWAATDDTAAEAPAGDPGQNGAEFLGRRWRSFRQAGALTRTQRDASQRRFCFFFFFFFS